MFPLRMMLSGALWLEHSIDNFFSSFQKVVIDVHPAVRYIVDPGDVPGSGNDSVAGE